jgi:hypothetical protein
MATRLSFRPRPLDHNKQLSIVRDVEELDKNEGPARDISHNHEALDKENEEVCRKRRMLLLSDGLFWFERLA